MDILAVIKSDHDQMDELFYEFEKIKDNYDSNAPALVNLYGRLLKLLRIHMQAEEEIFYPALKSNRITRAEIMEAIEEHHVARLLINELNNTEMSELWVAKMSVFQENIQHHNEEEEDELFEPARSLIDYRERRIMGEQFRRQTKRDGIGK